MNRALLLLLLLSLSAGSAAAAALANCVSNTTAEQFECRNIELLSHLPLDQIGGDAADGFFASDIWGWTSGTSGRRYALIGLRNATSFVDITDAADPVYIGQLPAEQDGIISDYRDIKVFRDHAFIVADTPYTAHGMQVFALDRLDKISRDGIPVTFDADVVYHGIAYGHNLWINEATGFAYIFRSDTCGAGEHMVDIRDPLNPVMAGVGCATVDGASSDGECVIYHGPDSDYVGRELCFVGSDSTVGISDVTDKAAPQTLAVYSYPGTHRAHQGVLSADHRYWYVSDTMDEVMAALETNTVILDISDIDNPQYVRRQFHNTTASDHNIYLANKLAVMANWRAGLRIADTSDSSAWSELAYIDTHPESDNPGAKSGAWSHYERYGNNIIALSDVERGLFVLRLDLKPTAVGLTLQQTAPQLLSSVLVSSVLLSGAVYLLRRRAAASI